MILLDVYFEKSVLNIDRPFLYAYDGEKPILKGTRVSINFGNQKDKIGYVFDVHEEAGSIESLSKKYGFEIGFINSVIDEEPILNDELMKLAEFISYRYVTPFIGAIQSILPPSLKPKLSYKSAPKIKYIKKIRFIKNINNLTKKQAEILKIIENCRVIEKNDIKNHDAILNKLHDLGCIEYFYDEKTPTSFNNLGNRKTILNSEQEKCYEEILNSNDKVFLLKGITGSGKTEVYFKLIENCLKSQRNAIILVPEINLTPQLKDRVLKHFDCEVAVLNSGLTQSERYDQYRKILRGNARIVLGTRSAIFAPLKNIGIIVIDEEFSLFYKNGNSPYYDTIEIAKFRANFNNAKIVLSSATPSIDSMARAKKNVYHLVEIKHRYNNLQLPNVSVVDMNNRDNIIAGHSLISKELYNSLTYVLSENKQAVLLVNRRGYSSRICCMECGKFVSCPECGYPMFYHKNGDVAFCHHCLKKIKMSDLRCDFCAEKDFEFHGFGTEKFYSEICSLFPNAKVAIFDSDNANNEKKISAILEDFSNKNIDILIGTEMIAKGHDFPNVALAAIVSCEELLDSYSFHASENAFQLITQTVGRSGRDVSPGFAIIQTSNPENKMIKLACNQDYDLFYETEMIYRKKTANPPYFYVDSINISSKFKSQEIHENYVKKIMNLLKSANLKDAKIYDKKVNIKPNGQFYSSIIIKTKEREKTLDIYNKIFKNQNFSSEVKLDFEIDTKE